MRYCLSSGSVCWLRTSARKRLSCVRYAACEVHVLGDEGRRCCKNGPPRIHSAQMGQPNRWEASIRSS
eukprot:103462-Chlamydomonas_euryale.AAC.2